MCCPFFGKTSYHKLEGFSHFFRYYRRFVSLQGGFDHEGKEGEDHVGGGFAVEVGGEDAVTLAFFDEGFHFFDDGVDVFGAALGVERKG